MDEELKTLLGSIKEQTDIDIAVYNETGAFFCTDEKESLTPIASEFSGVYADKTSGKTYFNLEYKGQKLTFYLSGNGQTQINYAKFILNLIENFSSKELVLSRKEYLRAILLGECNKNQIANYVKKFSAPSFKCFVMLVDFSEKKQDEVKEIIENYTVNSFDFFTDVSSGTIAYVKFIDKNSSASYTSPMQFAFFLQRTIYEETGERCKIYVGESVASFDFVRSSYETANDCKNLTKKLEKTADVFSYKENLLVKILEELPKAKLLEYYEILTNGDAKIVLENEELMLTAESVIENDLNLSETARKLYVHRNTLNYRLEKIEKATGLNIRRFDDALTFRLIVLLNKLKG